MVEASREPSMEEILASIKRIIAEDGDAGPASPAGAGRKGPRLATTSGAPPAPEPAPSGALDELPAEPDTLTLDSVVVEVPAPAAQPKAAQKPEEVLELTDKFEDARLAAPSTIVSDNALAASRSSLAALSALIVKPEPGADPKTLEGVVADMLRPMLKEWLDARLPELVEAVVAREVARITGRVI